jgi:3-deoxy-D-manno-octulosonic-acid transferase
MKPWLYRLLLLVLFPVFVYSAWQRCRKSRAFQPPIPACFKARFGFNPQPLKRGGIWIHAVSVGETRSIFPLLSALHARYPDLALTVTSGSTQGALQALKFSPVPIQHQMIPYDFPFAVNRFLHQIQPRLVIMIETEIWPNLYQACHQQNIPLVLANARLKQRSFEAYQKWGGELVKQALNQTAWIGAQFDIDREHFIRLGADPQRLLTLGNLKFDLDIAPDLAHQAQHWRDQHQLKTRFIWVAASTHDGEENQMLQAHQRLLQQRADALLILVPRHADRFDQVAELLQHQPLAFSQRSRQQAIDANTRVYLADSIGELMLWFAAADVAFIGGSLVNFGGHNILEPAALAKPVISGIYHQNLQALYDSFKQDQALTLVANAEQLAEQLIAFSQSTSLCQQKGAQAYHCFQQQTGALARTLEQLTPLISRPAYSEHAQKPLD